MPELKEIADALVAHCRAGTDREALETLYADDAVSVEAMNMPGMDGRETVGKAGISGKHDWWEAAMELHSSSLEGPFLHGDDSFAVIFELDATERHSGKRSTMREVGIYSVADGKIVREAFYYDM